VFTKYFVEYNTNKIHNIMSKFETIIFRWFFKNMNEIYTYEFELDHLYILLGTKIQSH